MCESFKGQRPKISPQSTEGTQKKRVQIILTRVPRYPRVITLTKKLGLILETARVWSWIPGFEEIGYSYFFGKVSPFTAKKLKQSSMHIKQKCVSVCLFVSLYSCPKLPYGSGSKFDWTSSWTPGMFFWVPPPERVILEKHAKNNGSPYLCSLNNKNINIQIIEFYAFIILGGITLTLEKKRCGTAKKFKFRFKWLEKWKLIQLWN